jgi:hypothetical protein
VAGLVHEDQQADQHDEVRQRGEEARDPGHDLNLSHLDPQATRGGKGAPPPLNGPRRRGRVRV